MDANLRDRIAPRTCPAPLKNDIDVSSRPHGKRACSGKPAAVVSAPPGAMGGFESNYHLRQPLVFLNMASQPAELL